MLNRTSFIISIFSILVLTTLGHAADIYFDINSTSSRRIDIALPYFSSSMDNTTSLKQDIIQTFKNDLEFSGRFNVLDISREYPTGTTENLNPDLGAWYLVGVQALVSGHISQGEGELLELSIRCFDVQMGQQIIGILYKTPVSMVRTVIHKFADEIQFRLTGERGINYTRIAFNSNYTGNSEIYAIDPDGGNLVQLTRNGSINLSPAWSSDNSTIYFTSFIDKHPDLFALNIEKKGVTSLIKGGMNITPATSSDGDKVALSISYDGDPEIVIYDVNSKTKKRITFSSGVDSNPTFAPNGRELAFVSDRSGTPQIYVMDIDGSNVRRLTKIGSYNTSPDWSPRGDWITYQSRRDGMFDIWLIHPDGSDEHPVTSDSGQNEDPCWARDGRHLAFVSTRSGGKGLFIMDISGQLTKPVLVQYGICGNPSWSR